MKLENGNKPFYLRCIRMLGVLAAMALLVPAVSIRVSAGSVPSRYKYIRHIQLPHVYSKEYDGRKLVGEKILEFGFGRKDNFKYYVTKANVHIKIRSMDGTLVYNKTIKVTKKNFRGSLCHIRIPDSKIRTNPTGPEGMMELTATLKDGHKVKCGIGKVKVYGLPTMGNKAIRPQKLPTTEGYASWRLINDDSRISPDAYHRLGSTQGLASDGNGHFLVFNAASPGTTGKYTNMLTWIGQDGSAIYQPIRKKVGHCNDATYYKGRFYVVSPGKGLPFVYGVKVKPKSKSLSLSWKKYKADSSLSHATGGVVNGISWCDGKTYKDYPVFIMRHNSRLLRCYLKGSKFHLINSVRIKNIPGSYTRQNVTYFKGKLYLGFAKLDDHGEKKNSFIVGSISYDQLTGSGSKKLHFSQAKSFSHALGVEVEGAAADNGRLYYSFNGNTLDGREVDFMISTN